MPVAAIPQDVSQRLADLRKPKLESLLLQSLRRHVPAIKRQLRIGAHHERRAEADHPFRRRQPERHAHHPPQLTHKLALRYGVGRRGQLRRLDTVRLAKEIQRGEDAARRVLERLVEAGLVQAHGATRGRTYTLSAQVYQRLGDMAGYVRQAGFDSIQQEQMVLQYAAAHGRITRKEAVELCHLSDDQASRLLRKLLKEHKLVSTVRGRGRSYRVP